MDLFGTAMSIALVILTSLLLLFWIVLMGGIANGYRADRHRQGGYYLFGRLILKGIRQAFLRPGAAQVAAYEILTPDPKEGDAEDARPMICLELNCERHGQHYREHTEKSRFSTEPFSTPTIV